MSFEPSSLASFATSRIWGSSRFLIGYAVKKVMKVMVIINGLIFVAFIYLEYNKVLSIDWSKIHLSVVDGLSGFVNMTNGNIPSGDDQLISVALTNYGIPITGSLAADFVVGFMKR